MIFFLYLTAVQPATGAFSRGPAEVNSDEKGEKGTLHRGAIV